MMAVVSSIILLFEYSGMNEGTFICVNCQLSYPEEATYKAHYKSEHHRYNVKRKLIALPPLSLHDYTLRNIIHNQNSRPSSHPRARATRKSTVRCVRRSSCLRRPTSNTSTPTNTKPIARPSSRTRVRLPLFLSSS